MHSKNKPQDKENCQIADISQRQKAAVRNSCRAGFISIATKREASLLSYLSIGTAGKKAPEEKSKGQFGALEMKSNSPREAESCREIKEKASLKTGSEDKEIRPG